ncbi:MAG: 6-carboxytetrahydropterin synthase QueD [Spirochaetales bacterium]|nr:6-carboxytetrahydropterin synthase QueD [Spirochaetales bacterium]
MSELKLPMTITLYTESYFNAAHKLKSYQGKCANLHGHAWKVGVWVKGEEHQKKANGILWDFSNIKHITARLDHTLLNDVLDTNPTAENIALYIYTELKTQDPDLLFKVRVNENSIPKESYCETGDF